MKVLLWSFEFNPPLHIQLRVEVTEESHLYPSQFAVDLAESLLTQYGARRLNYLWILLAVVTAVLIVLPTVKVDVTIQGNGQVRPITERVSIVVRAAGFVSELNVRDNDKVKKGILS